MAKKTALDLDGVWDLLSSGRSVLESRMKGHNRHDLTCEEVARAAIKPEDWDFCVRANAMFADLKWAGNRRVRWFVAEQKYTLTISSTAPPLPDYAKMSSPMPEAFAARLHLWTEQQKHIDKLWLQVYHATDDLRKINLTPDYLRFFLPGMLQLLQAADCYKQEDIELRNKLVAKLREFRSPMRLPYIDPELREACSIANGTIAAAALLSNPEEQDVTIELDN